MVSITFETHAPTFDNEAGISSGHFDVELSPLGIQRAQAMGERHRDEHVDVVFCSDLKRAEQTAAIAFGDRCRIVTDARLRECDYGDMTRTPSDQVVEERMLRMSTPFPNGESYEQTSERMRSFLVELLRDYDGKQVAIIGHRATFYGLKRWAMGIPLEQVLAAEWKWQPGWSFTLSDPI